MTFLLRVPRLWAAAVGTALSLGGAVAASADVLPPPVLPNGHAPLIAGPVPGGLTADEVAARAASTSHDVQAHAEDTAAALASVDQARAAFLPSLTGTARYTRLSSVPDQTLGNIVVAPGGVEPGPVTPTTPLAVAPLSLPTILNQYATQASLQIPLSDYLVRLPQLHDAASKSARAARLLEDASRLQVASDARVAYYDWARAHLQVDVAKQSLAQAQGHLADVKAAFSNGAASKADVLRVESQVASAELLLTRASTASHLMEARLRILTHDPSDGPYEIGEDLRDGGAPGPQGAAAPSVTVHERDTLLAEALRRRLEPRALRENADAVRHQAAATRAAAFPRLDAVGAAAYARPNSRIFPPKDELRGTWDASVQLSWTPTAVFSLEAGRSGQLARARHLDAEREQLADSISLEIDRAVQSLREAQIAVATSDRGLAAAEESYRVRRSLFVNGRATSVELTDAETELARARMDAIGARLDGRIAEVRLAHALGRDTRGPG